MTKKAKKKKVEPKKHRSFRELIRGMKAKHTTTKRRKTTMAGRKDNDDDDDKVPQEKPRRHQGAPEPKQDPVDVEGAAAIVGPNALDPPGVPSPAPNPPSAPGGDVIGTPPDEVLEIERKNREAREETSPADKRRP